MQSLISVEQAKFLIKSKEHMYKAMLRNNWYLPKLNTSIITQEYMRDIREQLLWCPKYSEIKLQPCPDPPQKGYLIKEVMKISEGRGLNLGIKEKRIPDKEWLIAVLGTLNKDHQIFSKNYLPPVKEPGKDDMVIDNGDDFYTNLPQLSKKRDLKAQSKLKVYLLGQKESKIKKLKELKAKIEEKIQEQGEQIKQMGQTHETIRVSKTVYEEMQLKLKEMEGNKKGGKNKSRTPIKQ